MAHAALKRWALLLTAFHLGCVGEPAWAPSARVPTTSPAAAPPPEPLGFGDTPEVARVRLMSQGIAVGLLDPAGWRREQRSSRSWVVRHAATGSVLVVRVWRESTAAVPQLCEAQARELSQNLPNREALRVVEESDVTLAEHYRSRVTVAVVRRDAASAEGHLLAFGGQGRECLMVVISASARGAEAEATVAGRLGAVSQAVFGHLRRLGIEERIAAPQR